MEVKVKRKKAPKFDISSDDLEVGKIYERDSESLNTHEAGGKHKLVLVVTSGVYKSVIQLDGPPSYQMSSKPLQSLLRRTKWREVKGARLTIEV